MKNDSAKFIKEKKDIDLITQDLIKSQNEIKDKVSKSEEIQDKNSEEYKKLYEEIKKDADERKVVYDDREKKMKKLEEDILNSKKSLLGKLEAKKELISKNIDNKDVKSFNIKELNEKKKMLQDRMKLSKTSKKEMEKMAPEKQKEVEEAKKSFTQDQAEFKKVRDDIDLYYLMGRGNKDKEMTPEKMIKQIEETMNQINEKFDMEHIEEMDNSQINEDKNKGKEDKSKDKPSDKSEDKENKSKQDEHDNDEPQQASQDVYGKLSQNIAKINEYMRKLDDPKITEQQKKVLNNLIDSTIEDSNKLIGSIADHTNSILNEGAIISKIGKNLDNLDETVKKFEKQKDISYDDMRKYTKDKKSMTEENINLFNKLYGLKDGGIQNFDPETRSKIYENIKQINGLFKSYKNSKNDPSLAASYRIAAEALKKELDELVQDELNKDTVVKDDKHNTVKKNIDKKANKTVEKDTPKSNGDAIILPDMQSLNDTKREKHERLKNEIYRLTNMMEQFKDNPEMCAKLKNMVDYLTEENEKLFVNSNKNSQSKNQERKGQEKDNQEPKNKSVNSNLNTNVLPDMKGLSQATRNKIDVNNDAIYKYSKMMEKYKDDPEKCSKIKEQIDILMNENQQLMQNEYNKQSKETNTDKKRPKLEFFVNTGYWLYVDENGDTFTVDLYDKDKKGKFKSCIKDEHIEEVKTYIMKEFGLTGYQVDDVDMQLWRVLGETNNIELRDKYIQAIKDGNKTDKGFDLIYDLQTKGKKAGRRKLDRKSKKQQIKNANRHEKLGLAKVMRDKKLSLGKILGGLAIGGAAILTAIGIGSHKPEKLGPAQITPKVEEGSRDNKDNVNKDFQKNKKDNKDNTLDRQQKDGSDIKVRAKITDVDENEKLDARCGDFVKVQSGSLLYVDPTDSINISLGKQPTQKIQVKSANYADDLYKVSMEGYYSPDGKSVCIDEGMDIDEALKEKGLDRSYLEDENTTKMYHVVSKGVAQWVDADAVEKFDREVDRLGNPIEKTDEEKDVEDAYKNYMEQRSQNQQNNEAER